MSRNVIAMSIAAMLCAAVALMGCDIFGADDAARGQVRVFLTDAPLDDFTEVYVTIDRVELLGGADEDDAVFVVSDDPQEFDLLELQNGVTALLGAVSIPEGRYHQLRLIVSEEADVELVDGSRLKIPSGPQTGIKVNFPPFDIEEDGDEVELTVDFDVNDSFVKAGASGQYIFKPVLKAEAIVVNGTEVQLDDEEDETEE